MKRPVVLVIRNDDRFSSLLRGAGCDVLNLDLIKTEPVEDLTDFQRKLAQIDRYDGMFFTSPVAAEIFAGEMAGRRFIGRIYTLGKRTKKILEKAGFDVVFRNTANTAEELIGSFAETEFVGKHLLFVRGDKSLSLIPRLLGENAKIDEVIVYRTLELPLNESSLNEVYSRLEGEEIDWVCFFSPSGVESFKKHFGSHLVKNLHVAAIGQTTAKRAAETDIRVSLISRRANAEDFAAELIEHVERVE